MIDEPSFMHEDPNFPEEPSLGYEISHSEAAVNEALERLLEYLRRLRRTGAETRDWTRRSREHLAEKLAALEVLKEAESANAILSDLMAWEGHILQVIRHYMQEVSDTINRIKTLNPPLNAHQLRPFIQAAEKDRSETIEALTPLTEALQQLSHHKRDGAPHSRTNA